MLFLQFALRSWVLDVSQQVPFIISITTVNTCVLTCISTGAVRLANGGAYGARSDDDIATHAKNWLKNSGDRDGGRKRRAAKKAAKKTALAVLAAAEATHLIAGVNVDAADAAAGSDTEPDDDESSESLFGTFPLLYEYTLDIVALHSILSRQTLSYILTLYNA